MKKPQLLTFLTFLFLTFFLTTPLIAQDTLKLGVLAKRGNQEAMEKWKPLVDYITEKTSLKMEVVALSFDAIEPAVKNKKIDYLIANSGYFVELEKSANIKAIASMLTIRQGKLNNRFGGVILVKADSPLNKVADLKGKKFMCVEMDSFGGCQMGLRHLIDNGLNPFKDFQGNVLEGKTHDAVVLAVQKGLVDSGTVRSDTLEQMEGEGKIKISDFKIIDKSTDDFPFIHSTILYPEWPFAALSQTSDENNKKIKDALISLQKDHPAAKAAQVGGWSEPLDYKPVGECLDAVKKAK
jgi:phosphate/phosphite/phosphonate ABC transporter binding protein